MNDIFRDNNEFAKYFRKSSSPFCLKMFYRFVYYVLFKTNNKLIIYINIYYNQSSNNRRMNKQNILFKNGSCLNHFNPTDD